MLTRARSLALLGASGAVVRPLLARAQAAPIRIGGSTSESYGQPYYALDAGFLGKAGLNVDIARFANAASSCRRAPATRSTSASPTSRSSGTP